MNRTTRFRIGIVLLTINQPLGWGAMLLCAVLALKTNRPSFYLLGTVAYALSWVMLGAGLLLTGREGRQYLSALLEGIRKLGGRIRE